MIVYPPMAEVSKDEPIEERLKKLIVRIDELSQDASKKTSQHFGRASSKFNNLMEEMSEDLRRRQDNLKERKETKKKQKVRIVRDTSPPIAKQVRQDYVNPVNSEIIVYQEPKSGLLKRISTAFINHLQFTFPAIVLLSSVIWIGYFAEGTLVNRTLEGFADLTGISIAAIPLVFFWGLIPGRIISYPIFTGSGSDLVGILDFVSLLLVIASFGFFYRVKFAPSFAISAFSISLIARFVIPISKGASISDIYPFELFSVILFTLLFCVLLTLPRFKTKFTDNATSDIKLDPDLFEKESRETGEASNQTEDSFVLDWDMTEATETLPRPKRPRGRSEYEMYEWVLLLVNLVLWPVSIISTMVVGANTEFMGMGPFNFDENWLLLVGAWAPTSFFFYLLYRMDAAARDGQTYHMEKVAYQEAMTRYTEAKNTYFELLTLQAEVRKQEIKDENPNLETGSKPITSE